jgi:hypothetical protein
MRSATGGLTLPLNSQRFITRPFSGDVWNSNGVKKEEVEIIDTGRVLGDW